MSLLPWKVAFTDFRDQDVDIFGGEGYDSVYHRRGEAGAIELVGPCLHLLGLPEQNNTDWMV